MHEEPQLNFADFEAFYENIIKDNINVVTLIGGEPTIHPDFLKILERLKNQQIFIHTNGLMFSNLEFLQDCIKTRGTAGLKSLSISLKGYDEDSFRHTTKTYKFQHLCHAIKNLKTSDISVTYSYTYAEKMTTCQIKNFISFLVNYQINNIVLNDVRPYFQANDIIIFPGHSEGLENFVHQLENADITVYLRLNHPLCEYRPSFINYALKNQRLITKCAVKTCRGYFFSASLELIPCNELFCVILGKYPLDFNNITELEQYWQTQYIRNFYERLHGYPDVKCKQCNLWRICGGSCILYWLNKNQFNHSIEKI